MADTHNINNAKVVEDFNGDLAVAIPRFDNPKFQRFIPLTKFSKNEKGNYSFNQADFSVEIPYAQMEKMKSDSGLAYTEKEVAENVARDAAREARMAAIDRKLEAEHEMDRVREEYDRTHPPEKKLQLPPPSSGSGFAIFTKDPRKEIENHKGYGPDEVSRAELQSKIFKKLSGADGKVFFDRKDGVISDKEASKAFKDAMKELRLGGDYDLDLDVRDRNGHLLKGISTSDKDAVQKLAKSLTDKVMKHAGSDGNLSSLEISKLERDLKSNDIHITSKSATEVGAKQSSGKSTARDT